MRRLLSVAVVALVLAGITGAAPAAASTAVSGTFHAVKPTRLLDTRAPNHASIGRGATLPLVVTGAVVPTSASAVVLTVTATSSTAGGYLTVYPYGARRPGTPNLDFATRGTVPNLVLTTVGRDGKINIYNGSSGGTDVLVDVSGYLTGSAAPAGQGAIGALPTPRRVLDTSHGIGAPRGAIARAHAVTFSVTGGGVPAGVSAVVINLTAVSPATAGYITGYASGASRPAVSNLTFAARHTATNLAVLPVGPDGKVSLYNGSSGVINVLADVAGYVLPSDPVSAGTFGSLAPTRLLDTHRGIGAPARPLGAGRTLSLEVGGAAGVPLAGASSVLLNVTASGGTRSGHLIVYGTSTAPKILNVNYTAGQTVSDLVLAQVSSSGTVTVYNGSSGSVHVSADVSGYVQKSTLPLPATSISRYVRNITGSFADASNTGDGCADAQAGSTFVLLDIGAQLNDGTGVALTVVDTKVTWAQLTDAINAYLLSFAGCETDRQATIALGTNNEGDFTKNPPENRGQDWAEKVVNAVTVPAAMTIAGANDIEGAFASTEAQAEQWESAYVAHTSQSLVFVGSADGCPTTYAAIGASCSYGWTQAQYSTLAGGLNPSRIQALPQIYLRSQAVQWANIYRAGGSHIAFRGALTENAACPTASSPGCSFAALAPSAGWAALFHSLSTVVTAPALPAVTDLRVSA